MLNAVCTEFDTRSHCKVYIEYLVLSDVPTSMICSSLRKYLCSHLLGNFFNKEGKKRCHLNSFNVEIQNLIRHRSENFYVCLKTCV